MEEVNSVPDHQEVLETQMNVDVLPEVTDSDKTGEYIGICKWFNNIYGYGFITIWDGPEKGKDCFCHHSGIKPLNSQYKTLKKGEYLSFDIIHGDKGQQAVNVRGIGSGPLLCDQVQVRKPPVLSSNGGHMERGSNWNSVTYKKKNTVTLPGFKRKRVGGVVSNDESVVAV